MTALRKLQKINTVVKGVGRHSTMVTRGFNRVYDDIMLADSPIPTVTAIDYLGNEEQITLKNFLSIDGNVSLDELVFICSLAHKVKPGKLLEIGTFDGNTALQLAFNTPESSRIATLDLPVGADGPPEVDSFDVKYIESDLRINRRFLGSDVERKVTQHYGNSLTYDFAVFAEDGPLDFIFIDAGHSYECVRNDTEKSLAILAKGGVIVWQDYTTGWPGVYDYLVELSATLPLKHIAGTTLVVYQS